MPLCPICGVYVKNVRRHLRRGRCEKQHNIDYKKDIRSKEMRRKRHGEPI